MILIYIDIHIDLCRSNALTGLSICISYIMLPWVVYKQRFLFCPIILKFCTEHDSDTNCWALCKISKRSHNWNRCFDQMRTCVIWDFTLSITILWWMTIIFSNKVNCFSQMTTSTSQYKFYLWNQLHILIHQPSRHLFLTAHPSYTRC